MVWLTSLPAWALVVFCLGVAGVAAMGAVGLRAFIPADQFEMAYSIAAPIMTALAAGFSVLMALTVANAATYLTTAQSIVNSEAADASRLAWAATSPGVDAAPVQQALLTYLESTRPTNGTAPTPAVAPTPLLFRPSPGSKTSSRVQASRKVLGTPASTELLASLDAVTSDPPRPPGRRFRTMPASMP